jgi:hypothetical protein
VLCIFTSAAPVGNCEPEFRRLFDVDQRTSRGGLDDGENDLPGFSVFDLRKSLYQPKCFRIFALLMSHRPISLDKQANLANSLH